ncbi:DNA polymerase III subunit gamma/tau [Candidimonas humi]|uniref:DNA polymerase III subunit gamma/tau n=1 Tax=Candidimonas humi TaxID=683355 RepID=A0ABV8NZR2_9BURK|nr:DNA polymerase III subunit gamma/tau [Candidimonas humi]MBV6306833.1 DNA polymerase III subunit gamma/tau [Candidimonas humi]
MTYLVLARKWRPRSFDTLVGQDHVVRALTHALATQRLHHAWLFTGTRGVGKTTLSRILAKSLNCETGITPTPCGTCRACTEIDAGRYVDYLELDAASNRGVEEMTQLLEQAVYAPSAGRFKVYMIDEVHMLTGHAFNAMLKTLEEPPPHVKFILATTDPQKIPVTVLSRCLQFNLKQMAAESIVTHLHGVLEQEGIESETPALRLLAQAAAGSMRDALSLTDQAIAYSAGRITAEAVQGMLGTIDQRHLLRLLQALADSSAREVLDVADELAARGLSYSGALADLAVMLSRVAIEQRVGAVLPDDDPLAGDLRALAGHLHPDLVQLFYSIAVHSRQELALAPDEYAGFVMACLRMLAVAPPAPEDGARASLPPAAEARGATAPAVSAAAAAPAPAAQGSAEPASGPAGSTASAVSGMADARDAHSTREAGPGVSAAESAVDSASPAPAAPVQIAAVQAAAAQATPASTPPVSMPAPVASAQTASTQTAPAQTAPQASVAQAAAAAPAPEADRPDGPAAAPQPSPAVAAILAARSRGAATKLDAAAADAAAGSQVRAGSVPDAHAHEDSAPADAAFEDSAPQDGAMDASASDEPPDYGDDIPAWEDGPMADASGYTDIDDASYERDDMPLDQAMGDAGAMFAQQAPRADMPRLADMSAGAWPELAAKLPLTGLAAELARQSEWLGSQGARVRLRVAVRSLAESPGKSRLRTVLSEHFGTVVELDVEYGRTGEDTAHAVEQARRAARQKEAEQAVQDDPLVRTLIDDFGATVVAGSVRAESTEPKAA